MTRRRCPSTRIVYVQKVYGVVISKQFARCESCLVLRNFRSEINSDVPVICHDDCYNTAATICKSELQQFSACAILMNAAGMNAGNRLNDCVLLCVCVCNYWVCIQLCWIEVIGEIFTKNENQRNGPPWASRLYCRVEINNPISQHLAFPVWGNLFAYIERTWNIPLIWSLCGWVTI